MRRVNNCPICDKPLSLIDSTTVSDTEALNTYKCGHAFVETIEHEDISELNFTACNGVFQARDYQKEGIEFIINSGFNCVIGDQMRLGKTPQFLMALANRYQERTPCLIIVKSANLYQWQREYKTWTDALPMGIFAIEGTKSFIPPGFSTYLISMDTFSRPGTCRNCGHSASFHNNAQESCRCKVKDDKGVKRECGCRHLLEENSMVQRLLEFGFKLVGVDEAHSFKNTDSNRSQALVQFLHKISQKEITQDIKISCMNCKHEWEDVIKINVSKEMKRAAKTVYCPKCNAWNQYIMNLEHIERKRECGIVMLTGTAIKNRADEYFIPLNLVAPEVFPSLENFRRRWLIQDDSGKFSRISPYAFDKFKEIIKPYVLRREKEDVYKDLPPINRMFTVIDIEDPRFKESYNKALDQLAENMDRNPNMTAFDSIGELSKLRQICGVAKVDWTADYLEDTIRNDGKDKYAIGIHHHAVRDMLAFKLQDFGVMTLSGEDNAEKKDHIMTSFRTSKEKVLILNMLAGGVGMDFHYCHKVTILERQWNAADEEQFEFRFYNPDPAIMLEVIDGKEVIPSTDVEYIIARGTIDEWFYAMVEEKRQIFGETIGTNWTLGTDSTSLKELLEQAITHRL